MPEVTQRAPLPTASAVAPAVAPANTEAPAIETPKEEERLSPRFAALARQQKELRLRQEQIKSQELAVQKQLEDMRTKYESEYVPKSKFTQDFYGALQDVGINQDQVLQYLNSQANQDPAIRSLQAKIQELEAKVQEPMKRIDEQQSQAYNQAVEQIRHEASALIDSDSSFELTKAMNMSEAVVQLIEETFKKDKRLLTVQEAAEKVEDHILEEAIKYASLDKVKAKLAPVVETPIVPTQQKSPLSIQKTSPIPPPIKTLTNAVTASPSKSLTSREKRERAILAFKGQLN